MAGAYKKVPDFWWDFEWQDGEIKRIIIECDHPRYPVVATVSTPDEAEIVLDDLRSGRRDFRVSARELAEARKRYATRDNVSMIGL